MTPTIQSSSSKRPVRVAIANKPAESRGPDGLCPSVIVIRWSVARACAPEAMRSGAMGNSQSQGTNPSSQSSASVWLEARIEDHLTVSWRDPIDGAVLVAASLAESCEVPVACTHDVERSLLHVDAGDWLKVTVKLADSRDQCLRDHGPRDQSPRDQGGENHIPPPQASPILLFASGALLERLGVSGGRASEPGLFEG